MRKINYIAQVLVAASIVIGMSACSVLPKPKPAPTVYRLSIPQSGNSSISEHLVQAKIINIAYPEASKALSSTDIVLSPDGRRLTAAGGASWSEPVPSLLRNALIDTLSAHSKITGVHPKGGTRVPYRLHMDIRRFEAIFDNGEEAAPKAVVQINLSLTDTATRHLISNHTVQAQSRASELAVSSIVEAQDRATRKAMQDIVSWLETELSTGGS